MWVSAAPFRYRRHAIISTGRGRGRHVLIAGGIGITPMLAMTKYLAQRDFPFELHYCAHELRSAPFLSDLKRNLRNPTTFDLFLGRGGRPPSRLNVHQPSPR